MNNVNEVFAAWQLFFTTLTMAGATLAGLLFVALSLHVSALRKPENLNLRHLAQHTFGSFVTILFIGLFYIVPESPRFFYGSATLITVAFGLAHMLKRFHSVMQERDNQLYRRYYLRNTLFSFVAYVLMFIGGLGLLIPNTSLALVYYSVLWVFVGSAMMLVWAMRNSWYLLAHELGDVASPDRSPGSTGRVEEMRD